MKLNFYLRPACLLFLVFQNLLCFAITAAPQDDPFQALRVAVHLTRPEVIRTCLREIEESEYEFVWKDLQEKPDPVKSSNSTHTLTAMLMRKSDLTKEPTKTRPNIVGEAYLIVRRDIERLRRGELYFDCRIDYRMYTKVSR